METEIIQASSSILNSNRLKKTKKKKTSTEKIVFMSRI